MQLHINKIEREKIQHYHNKNWPQNKYYCIAYVLLLLKYYTKQFGIGRLFWFEFFCHFWSRCGEGISNLSWHENCKFTKLYYLTVLCDNLNIKKYYPKVEFFCRFDTQTMRIMIKLMEKNRYCFFFSFENLFVESTFVLAACLAMVLLF